MSGTGGVYRPVRLGCNEDATAWCINCNGIDDHCLQWAPDSRNKNTEQENEKDFPLLQYQ